MKSNISIVWFRQDLRVSDNPALAKAAELGKILSLYVLNDGAPPPFQRGRASQVWLYHSLAQLNQSLEGKLNIYEGPVDEIIHKLLETYPIKNVFWNMCYEPWYCQQENAVKTVCDKQNVKYEIFHSHYLWHPEDILKNDGSYYKVFTAFKNKACAIPLRKTIQPPKDLLLIKDSQNQNNFTNLCLLPSHSWHKTIEDAWDIGEKAAQDKLHNFIEHRLSGYKQFRDYPGQGHTSQLSAHLHFGEITPAQICETVFTRGPLYASKLDIECFYNEIIWREFSGYLLYHFPNLPIESFLPKFHHFPWIKNTVFLRAWQQGQTGYPLVDAGMRQLWQTGYMHNRLRMITASFLVKNLCVHWHEGRDWFWDCLVDADLGNNSASWQWVTGCGVDAAPYFRIFNPITQGEKFDKDGQYTRQFVPELKDLPDQYLFKPWRAPESVLKAAGVILGKTYPYPIVDLMRSREQALEDYKRL